MKGEDQKAEPVKKRKVGDVIERKPKQATKSQLEKDLRKDRVR